MSPPASTLARLPLTRIAVTGAESEDLAVRGAHVVGERPRDRAVVGDRGRRRVQARDGGGVRLELAQLVALDPPQPGHGVRRASSLELAQPLELGLVDRDDELPALVVGEAALRAVGAQQLDAAPAQARLQRPGRVVDARVDDAAVAAGLVQRDVVLLLEHGHDRVGPELRQPPRDREPEDAGADDSEPLPSHSVTVVHGTGEWPSGGGGGI